jgi:ketosteroid isomerase-like protein
LQLNLATTRRPKENGPVATADLSSQNVLLIRQAYDAYARGDNASMLELIDLDLEWTYFDPMDADLHAHVCRGRGEFEIALARRAERGLMSELEEVVGQGDRVMVVVRTPGVDAYRVRSADDLNFDVFTFRDGKVVAMRACLDRAEACAAAGID